MSESILYVGLDYHQNSVRVCAMNVKAEILVNRDVDSDWRAIRNAVGAKWSGPVHAAIEACCGAAAMADELVLRAGWSVDLAHPGYVSRMKQTMEKTDKTDGHVLADLSRVGYLPKVWLARRAEVSQGANTRYLEALALLDTDSRVGGTGRTRLPPRALERGARSSASSRVARRPRALGRRGARRIRRRRISQPQPARYRFSARPTGFCHHRLYAGGATILLQTDAFLFFSPPPST